MVQPGLLAWHLSHGEKELISGSQRQRLLYLGDLQDKGEPQMKRNPDNSSPTGSMPSFLRRQRDLPQMVSQIECFSL